MEPTDRSARLPRTAKELREFWGSGNDVARIELFSDAVFAIAITLLALEIRIPVLDHHAKDSEILGALSGLGRSLFSFVISFLLIGVQWVRHHALFRLIRKHDPILLAINLFGLMLVTLVPLPTALYGHHIGSVLAVAVFYGFHAVVSAVWAVMWVYSAWGNRLIAPEMSRGMVRYITMTQCVQPLLMLGAMIAALFGGVQAAAAGVFAGVVVARLALHVFGRSIRSVPAA